MDVKLICAVQGRNSRLLPRYARVLVLMDYTVLSSLTFCALPLAQESSTTRGAHTEFDLS